MDPRSHEASRSHASDSPSPGEGREPERPGQTENIGMPDWTCGEADAVLEMRGKEVHVASVSTAEASRGYVIAEVS